MKTTDVTGYLVFNWKEGSHRTRKSAPDDLGTYELATPFELTVEIPDVDIPEIAAKISVPQPHVQTAVLESLDDEHFDEWSDVADRQLKRHVETIQHCDGLGQVDAIADRLTTQTLIEYEGLVDAEKVQAYLQDHAHRIHKDAPEEIET